MTEGRLFDLAVCTPEADRTALLDRECAGNPELRRRVEALLAADAAPKLTIDSPLDGTASYGGSGAEPGAVIAGRYTLVERVGEGGMGEVWVAKQSEPVKRKVALKLIKTGMDSKAVLQRFEQERQALALMDHPNIAKVLDGGLTPQGQPFFVMELVNGLPLNRFCDEAKLGIRERLELFVAICQAVQHAHQKGVVHRDLKPSNILVTISDGRGVPKVIDFGVAKAISGKLTDESLSTQFGGIVGTLEYMAPEQAGYSGHDIDTRADVYSLGVLLYELLTGLKPLDAKRLREAALTEMIRIIREEEPSNPSTRLSTDEGLPSLAALRQSEPKKLTAMLRGDLDWITMKCLEKDRARRYETANGVARDIQRYLSDEPVEATPPSTAYRVRKFLRRNKGPAVATAVVVLTLIGGIVGTTWGMIRADNQRKLAEDERDAKDKALTAEIKAREGERQARNQAMSALRAMTDEIVENQMARGTNLTDENKEFLRRIIQHFEGFAAITSHDAESRFIRADGLNRVGMMRHRLGELKEAEAALTDALTIRNLLVVEFPTNPEFRRVLAQTQASWGNLLTVTGRLKEAEAAHSESRDILKQLAAEFPSRPEFRFQLAGSHVNLGRVLDSLGRLTETKTNYTAAQSMLRQLVADYPNRFEYRQRLATCQNNLAILLSSTGRLKDAVSAYEEALAIRKQLVADFPARPDLRRDLAMSYGNLQGLYNSLSRQQDAETAAADALLIRKQLATEFPTRLEFRAELAASYVNLGLQLSETSRLEEAEAAFADALVLLKQLTKDLPNRPDFRQHLAKCYTLRSNLLRKTGRLKEAEAGYFEAVAILKSLAAAFPTHVDFRHQLAEGHHHLGILNSTTGRHQEAEAAFKDALAIQKELVSAFPRQFEYRSQLAETQHQFAILMGAAGRSKEAEAAYSEALVQRKQLVAVNPNQPNTRNDLAATYVNLAILSMDRRDYPGAKTYLDEAQEHHQSALKATPQHPVFREYWTNHLFVRTSLNAAILNQPGAVETAAMIRDLGWNPPIDAFDAACALTSCILNVEKQVRLLPNERQTAMQFYGDEAVKLLRDAVAKGFKNTARLKTNKELDPLRERDDFKKLLAELDKKPESKP